LNTRQLWGNCNYKTIITHTKNNQNEPKKDKSCGQPVETMCNHSYCIFLMF